MAFIDLFSDGSELYASARPQYPDALFAYLASIAPARERAWDCGTGNGQAAIGLARHFREVCATDASAQQLAQALRADNVEYSHQPAEQTSFPARHFDLVCVAQALHWFDLKRFFAEVHRVLRPHGIFAAWTYNWFKISPEIDAIVERQIFDVLRPYWPIQVHSAWRGYRDIDFPFQRIQPPPFELAPAWTLQQLLAYLHTWSGTRRYIAEHGAGWLESATNMLAEAWGAADARRPVKMGFELVVGRISAT